MARIFVLAFTVALCGGALAAAPEFDTEHFCTDFASGHTTANMSDMAKAVCVLSEQSTKDHHKAWDRVSATNKDTCLRTARELYVYLAKCRGPVQGR